MLYNASREGHAGEIWTCSWLGVAKVYLQVVSDDWNLDRERQRQRKGRRMWDVVITVPSPGCMGHMRNRIVFCHG